MREQIDEYVDKYLKSKVPAEDVRVGSDYEEVLAIADILEGGELPEEDPSLVD